MAARSIALFLAVAVASPVAAVPGLARAAAVEPSDELPKPEDMSEAQARQVFQGAFVAYQMQEYEVAVELGGIALQALVRLVGWTDQETQGAGMVVIDSLRKLGRDAEADALFAIAQKEMGITAKATSPGTTKMLESMQAYSDGRTDAAYELARDAVAMLERDEPDHPELATYRAALAQLAISRHEFAYGEQLLQENLARAQKSGDAKVIAAAHNGIGRLEHARGAYDRATAQFERALDELKKSGEIGDEAENAHDGLGDVAFELGKLDAAIASYKKRLDLAERDFGGDMRLIGALGDLGHAYEETGRFADAQPLLEREDAIIAKVYGEESSLRFSSLTRLGRLHRSKGDYDQAIEIWKRVLAMEERMLPAESPSIGGTLNHYAETLWAADREPALLISLATRAAELNERYLIQEVSVGSEAQKRAALAGYVSGTDRVITYNVHYAANDPAATRLGINTVLRRKGRVLDAVSGAQEAMRGRVDASTQAELDRLRERRGQVATLLVRGPGQNESPQEYRAKITAAQQEVEQLEKAIGDRNAVPEDLQPVELARVQAEIPDDAALVELAVYRRFDPRYKSFA
jgi:tetratricopeptide (TPR) repeat protein